MAERWPGVDEGQGPVWDLPDAAVVRRRGEAIGRRRAGVQVLGATIGAVAVLALPGVLVIGTGGAPAGPAAGPSAAGTTSPGAATGPAPAGWRDTVPAGFDITAGMDPAGGQPVVSSPDEHASLRTDLPCGEHRWTRALPDDASDALMATRQGQSGGLEHRVVLVYPDDDTAHRAFDAIRRGAGACGSHGPGQEASLSDDVGGSGSDESWALVVTGPPTAGGQGGTESVLAVRVGNAVLLERTATAALPAPGEIARWLDDRTMPVVAQMCVFAARPDRRSPAR